MNNSLYEEIKKAVEAQLVKEKINVPVEVRIFTKNNNTKQHGLIFLKDKVSPIIYLDYFYHQILDGEIDVEGAAKKIVSSYQKEIKEESNHIISNISNLLNYSNVKEKIFPYIVNFTKNSETLQNCPSEKINDLAIIYKIEVSDIIKQNATITITNEILSNLNISEKALREQAWQNLDNTKPLTIINMNDILKNMGVPEFMLNISIPMYVCTNQEKINGAVYLGKTKYFEAIAEKLNDSFIILPSSIHEFIVIPQQVLPNKSSDELKEMVMFVNNQEVCVDEQLSDNAYFYDKDTKTFSLYDTRDMEHEDR